MNKTTTKKTYEICNKEQKERINNNFQDRITEQTRAHQNKNIIEVIKETTQDLPKAQIKRKQEPMS